MTDLARMKHAELIVAAIRAEALAGRMDDDSFRDYCLELTSGLDLPDPVEAPHAA